MKADRLELAQIPFSENEIFEFKSSRVASNRDSFAGKVRAALSGFANSGGGFFIVGVDDKTGLVDGGISRNMGGQSLSDWIDTIARQVEPTPKYSVNFINDTSGRGNLIENNVVLVVAIEESFAGPPMAQDHVYYLRTGAHTVPARHFIVEAIRAKRYQSKPKLTHLFRLKPNRERILQLGILALTDSPAIGVHIQLSPLPKAFKGREQDFPIKIPVIDQSNPFFFDVSFFAGSDEEFGNDVTLKLNYNDLMDNEYEQEATIGVDNSTQPVTIGNDYQAKIFNVLNDIKDVLQKRGISKRFEHSYTPIINPNEDSIEYVNNLMPDLISEMRTDLLEHPYRREFIIFGKHWVYNGNANNEILAYYFEDHGDLRGKVRILENCGLVYNISFNEVDRFVITELFAQELSR